MGLLDGILGPLNKSSESPIGGFLDVSRRLKAGQPVSPEEQRAAIEQVMRMSLGFTGGQASRANLGRSGPLGAFNFFRRPIQETGQPLTNAARTKGLSEMLPGEGQFGNFTNLGPMSLKGGAENLIDFLQLAGRTGKSTADFFRGRPIRPVKPTRSFRQFLQDDTTGKFLGSEVIKK